MVFASVGSIRQSALRRRAIANMFLFDSAVSKDMLRGKNNLFSLASECRSMAYSFELDGIKTTPISGVKDNRFFPVFSGYVTQFNMGASNVTNYHDISSTTDVSTADERSDKFVTVQESFTTGTITGRYVSLLGGASSNPNLDVTELPERSRFYLLPASRNSLYSGRGLTATPYFDGAMKSFKNVVGSYTYAQMFSAGAYGYSSYVSGTDATVLGQDTTQAVYGAGTEVLIVSSRFLSANTRYLFVNAQYQSAVAGQSGWSKYAGYMTQLRGMKTSVFPHFRIASTPNDPDCTFVLGAARCKSSIGTEMILIDIGDSPDADVAQTSKAIAETSQLALKSDAVKSIINPVATISM